ncbi:MAG: DUF262 domain-containing protein, partial [Solirubrobacteraceae bacterium]
MPTEERRIVAHPIAWFNDLNSRGLLNLTPPYQRRSVWNRQYRAYFIETILLNYPAPPIFLHETIDSDGVATYSVVDGKQRLTTIFEFIDNEFAVAEDSSLEQLQGETFADLDKAVRQKFWQYQLPVEFLPYTEAVTLKNIFDRLNRNVARLSRQELRHARFEGEFAKSSEAMSDLLHDTLPADFPHIARASTRQMRDVELVAQLLLLSEDGPESLSQDDLDEAYSSRDEEWVGRVRSERRFRRATRQLSALVEAEPPLAGSRLRNQADFYSLFGAVLSLM